MWMINPFRYYKTSPDVIRVAVMMYVRFPLSLRQVEDLLHERGIDISYETVRVWWNRFGPMFAAEIRKKRSASMRGSPQWRWHLDEVLVRVNGETHYLWRAVDHEGEVLEAFVTKRRDRKAALRFLKKAMKRYGGNSIGGLSDLPHPRCRRVVVGRVKNRENPPVALGADGKRIPKNPAPTSSQASTLFSLVRPHLMDNLERHALGAAMRAISLKHAHSLFFRRLVFWSGQNRTLAVAGLPFVHVPPLIRPLAISLSRRSGTATRARKGVNPSRHGSAGNANRLSATMITFHLTVALLAFALGTANLILAKGTVRHRAMGWVWMVLMAGVTLSSLAIRQLNDGRLSWIHGLTLWTLFSMAVAVFAIRRGKVRLHAGFMIGTMVGVIIAGLFALAPGRFISEVAGY